MRDIRHERFVLAPAYEDLRSEFATALEQVWLDGGWTVNLDELFALTQLKLTAYIDRLLTQGRSKHLTVVAGMQRPVGVTRNAIAQATHVLCAFQEGRDLKTVVEATSPRFAPILNDLARYEFGWYYRPNRQFWRGRAQDLFRVESREEPPQ